MRKWARGNHTPGGHIVLVTCHRHERQRPALVESSRVRVRVCASREEERLCQIRGQHRAASRPLSCFHMSVLHSCYISSTYILIKFGTPRYSVGQLSRAMGRPTPVLYDSALRVVHYLHRTRDIGLRYEASSRPLHGYSDSDWAVRHSTLYVRVGLHPQPGCHLLGIEETEERRSIVLRSRAPFEVAPFGPRGGYGYTLQCASVGAVLRYLQYRSA